jgi:hypothetical protein
MPNWRCIDGLGSTGRAQKQTKQIASVKYSHRTRPLDFMFWRQLKPLDSSLRVLRLA